MRILQTSMLKPIRNLYLLVFCVLISCQPHYTFLECPPPLPECPAPAQPVRLALVLGGGGVRGMAHVGVLQEFENAGIPIDAIVGCSVGSLVGVLYADSPNAERLHAVLRPIKKWDILDVNICKSRYGFVQGNSLRRFLYTHLHAKTFECLQIPFRAVATDLHRGDMVCFGSGPVIPAVHASCSIPFFFAPVQLHGRLLVDGGVSNPVPAIVAKEMDAQIVVVVDLCELLPPTCPTNLFQVATRCGEIIFNKQSEGCLVGADVIIRPALGEIGTFDDRYSEKIYQAGRQAAREAIPRIKELLYSNLPYDGDV